VSGLLWRKEEERSRTFCFMSDALFITHIQIVGQHPHTLWWGTHQATLTDVTDKLRTPAGGGSSSISALVKPWAHQDREKFFTDEIAALDAEYPRCYFGYCDHADKYGPKRLDGLEHYATKMMIQHRFQHHTLLFGLGICVMLT
jgi:hypothetical protein